MRIERRWPAALPPRARPPRPAVGNCGSPRLNPQDLNHNCYETHGHDHVIDPNTCVAVVLAVVTVPALPNKKTLKQHECGSGENS